MLTGLARDGGLYVPAPWPQLSHETIASFFGRPYWEVAVDVIKPFTAGGNSPAAPGPLGRAALPAPPHPPAGAPPPDGARPFLLWGFPAPPPGGQVAAEQ